MSLPAALQETLTRVAAMTAATDGPWWIIGSAAVALHGAVEVAVADVDLLVGDETEALHLVRAFGMSVADDPPSHAFRSRVFGRWHGAPLAVELISGFRYRRAGQWEPVCPQTRLHVPWGDGALFIPDREELAGILMAFARPKDLARASLLAG